MCKLYIDPYCGVSELRFQLDGQVGRKTGKRPGFGTYGQVDTGRRFGRRDSGELASQEGRRAAGFQHLQTSKQAYREANRILANRTYGTHTY